MADTAIFDVDGTLVDTNYQHALAWFRAFRRLEITVPLWRLHRAIGMGGDKLVSEVSGPQVERAHGDELRAAWAEEFKPFVEQIQPFEGAHELLKDVKERGFQLVLASSGTAELVNTFMDLVGAHDLADAWTSSEDAGESKPAPDIVQSALAKIGRDSGAGAALVGDSTWDAIAAGKVGIAAIAVLTGGFSSDELREAGAGLVYDSLTLLREDLDHTPLARAR
jgi:HAD superfamily hydrolase (TIGR01549 family)